MNVQGEELRRTKNTDPRKDEERKNSYTENLALQASVDIFEVNFQELRAQIVALQKSEPRQMIELIREREQLFQIQFEIVRLFHNYVAAAYSLLSHTRNLYREFYEGTGNFPDYQDKVNSEFADDPLAQFVQGLRQYCQHYRSPDSVVTISGTPSNWLETIKVTLPLQALRAYKGWNARAKKYLDRLTMDVDILEVATIYRNKVLAFNEWFMQRQRQIADASQPIGPERNREIMEFRRMLLRSLENQIVVQLENKLASHFIERELFVNFLTPDNFLELDMMPPDSPARPTRVIQIIENTIDVPNNVKQEIHRLYTEKKPIQIGKPHQVYTPTGR